MRRALLYEAGIGERWMNDARPEVRSARPRFAVVIPAFNVSKQISRVISRLPAWVDHVIVVDDCGQDDTKAVVRAIGDPRLELIERETNGGVGAAMKSGYERALVLGAEVIIKMDGDDQMDPSLLPSLVAPILRGHADYTKGNRFRAKAALSAMPLPRRLGNLGLSFLTKVASGYWNIFDPTNGYTAIRREALAALPLSRIADRYFFEISMLVQLNITGALVKDVFMPSRYQDEKSSMRIGVVLASFPARLAGAAIERLWNKHFIYDFTAVSLFLVAGLPLIGLGGVLGTFYWSRSIRTGIPATAGQVMLSVLPLLVGFQLVLQSFVIDIGSVPQTSQYGPITTDESFLKV
jgi:dolichol-phosphate mannosyltransferase